MITLIAAVARNGVIGNGNAIPWYIPADFKHFKETTQGKTVIMGSRTWESLPARSRPLPNRTNIVLTSKAAINCPRIPEYPENVLFVQSLDSALYYCVRDNPSQEVFVIGGATLYAQTIDRAKRLIISEIDLAPEGDTFFPKIDSSWKITSRTQHEGFAVVVYERD